MSGETFLAVLTVAGPMAVAALGVAWGFARRLARIETRGDICWDFVMRRATSEGVNMGVLFAPAVEPNQKRLPPLATDAARGWFDGMKDDLQAFYRTVGKMLSERSLFIEVEKRFGDRLLHEICIPHGMIAGACIWAAIDVARGAD